MNREQAEKQFWASFAKILMARLNEDILVFTEAELSTADNLQMEIHADKENFSMIVELKRR